MQVGLYRVRIRFERLYADPSVFDEPEKLAQRYLVSAGLPREKTRYLQQTTREVVPVDGAGKPSAVVGTAKYRVEGKRVRSEYMKDATLEVGYVDFGSGLSWEDHERLWKKRRWGEMSFEVRQFDHRSVIIDLPDITDLYEMLRVRAVPTTVASIELKGVPEDLFHSAFNYLKQRLENLAAEDGVTVEIYAARYLAQQERQALERRLGQESTASTVHVILSKGQVQPP